MGNPQGTLTSYIAGLMDGEGSIWIGRIKYKDRFHYRSTVMITNTDIDIIQTFINYLKYHKLSYSIRADDRRKAGRRICYSVQITRDKDKLTFIGLVKPYLSGTKKRLATIAENYLVYRMTLFAEIERRRLPNGRYGKSVNNKHGEAEEQFFQQYKLIKDASETTSKTLTKFE